MAVSQLMSPTVGVAQESATQESVSPATTANRDLSGRNEVDQTAADRGRIILVVGASGTPEFGEQFLEWSSRWKEVASKSSTQIDIVGFEESDKPNDRERLQALLADAANEPVGPLWLILIGHGTYARDQAKFNLRGPDFSAKDLSTWLAEVKRPVVVVNCASASGPFVNRLSGPGRVIVTATKSGAEQNYARFGRYFAEAIASADSDLDHDGEVSVHEAFLRASADVRIFYEVEARISTEHALIDDNGDGRGTPASLFRGVRPDGKAKDGAKLDGSIASRVTLAPVGGRLPFTRQELASRERLEDQLESLRLQRDEMDEQAFDAQVEPLLLQLAKIYAAAEARESTAKSSTD